MEKESRSGYNKDWYLKNRAAKLEKSRLYDEKNSDNAKERKRKYYEKNKEMIIAKFNVKTKCDICNKDVSHIDRHLKTKRHLKNKDKLENPDPEEEIE